MSNAANAPKHLWIVGIVTLLWNLMGAYDYLMTQTRNEAYMGKFEQAQLDYFYSFPTWVEASWALAVWGGVLGCILLLMRKGWAVKVFLMSFLCMVITAVYNFGLSNGWEVMGPTGLIFTLLIFIVALGLWLYSRGLHGRGVLS